MAGPAPVAHTAFVPTTVETQIVGLPTPHVGGAPGSTSTQCALPSSASSTRLAGGVAMRAVKPKESDSHNTATMTLPNGPLRRPSIDISPRSEIPPLLLCSDGPDGASRRTPTSNGTKAGVDTNHTVVASAAVAPEGRSAHGSDLDRARVKGAKGPFAVSAESCDEESRSQTSTSTPASTSQPRTHMSGMSPDFMRELVERIKAEVVQGLQQQSAASDGFVDRKNSYTSTAAIASPPASLSPSTALEPDAAQAHNMMAESPFAATVPATTGLANFLGVHQAPLSALPAQQYPSAFESRKSSARWTEHRPIPPIGRSASTPEVNAGTPLSPQDRRPFKRTLPDIGWGPLFGEDGNHTERLSRFLKGIASYITTEFQPCNGIAIMPANMEAFHAKFTLDFEVLPLQDIFKRRSKGGLERIENLYLDLECEHVLVQADPRYRADIPALTPSGFEKWMRNLIQAYPDHEAQRLSMIIEQLPINPDGSRLGDRDEKLYTSLPRRLLPAGGDDARRQTIWEAVTYWRKATDASKTDSSVDPPLRRHTDDGGHRQRCHSRDATPARANTGPAAHSSSGDKPIIRQAFAGNSAATGAQINKRSSVSDMPPTSGMPGKESSYILSSESHRGVEQRYRRHDVVEVDGGSKSARRVYVAETPRHRCLTGIEEERTRRRKAYLASSRMGDRERGGERAPYGDRERDRDNRGPTYDELFRERERSGMRKSYDVES